MRIIERAEAWAKARGKQIVYVLSYGGKDTRAGHAVLTSQRALWCV